MDLEKILIAGYSLLSKEDTKREISRVCEELWLKGRDETTIESYVSFNQDNPDYIHVEHNPDLLTGNGLSLSTTKFDEIQFLWDIPDLYLPAEAQLLYFHKQHGKYVNIICSGPELGDRAKTAKLSMIAFRHQIIGLTPMIAPYTDLSDVLRRNGVNCDVFVTINGRVAYLFSFYHSGGIIREHPLFIRTTYKNLVNRLEGELKTLKANAISYDKYAKTFKGGRLTKAQKKEVEGMAADIFSYYEFIHTHTK